MQTKGPIALVLCGLTMLLLMAFSADLRRRLLALHWAIGPGHHRRACRRRGSSTCTSRFKDGFVNGYILDENFRLFAASRFANQPGFWFYFQILAAALLPWTGLLIGRLVDDVARVEARRAARRRRDDALGWTLAVVGFFTLSTFKLDHYVFPAAPALCLLCARAWSRRPHRSDGAAATAASRVGLYLIGPFLVAVGVGCGYFLIARLELPVGRGDGAVALTLAGALLAALANVRGARPPRMPWMVMIALIATYIGLILFVLPALEQRKVVPDMARWVATRAQPDDRIASFRLNRWTPAYGSTSGATPRFWRTPKKPTRSSRIRRRSTA